MAPLAAFVLSLHFFMQGLYSWSEAPPSGIERPHTTSVVPSVGEGEQPDLQDPAVTYACPLLLVRVPLVAPAPAGRGPAILRHRTGGSLALLLLLVLLVV